MSDSSAAPSSPAPAEATSPTTDAAQNPASDATPTTSAASASASASARLLGAFGTSMKTGIRTLGDNLDANLQTAAAGLAAGVTGAVRSLPTASIAAGLGAAGLGAAALGPAPVASIPDRSAAQAMELVYRTRDYRRSSDALSKRFLAREVDYASGACAAYTKTLKEVQNSKAVLRPLHDAVGSLAAGVGSARTVAAGFAGGDAATTTTTTTA
jgi:hypothetical protein